MTEQENKQVDTSKFERINIQENFTGLPEAVTSYPVLATGQWSEENVSFHLRWDGGYYKHFDSSTRNAIREKYLGSTIPWNWKKAKGPRQERLLSLKDLPLPQRKSDRKKIMPFPGVVMTFEHFDVKDGKVTIQTRVGNYAEIHPDFGIGSPEFAKLFPGHEEDLKYAAQGMGVQIIIETADGYHIFGQRAAGIMGAGFIGGLGITPNISDEHMKKFIEESGKQKELDVPINWLFDSIKADISEPDELNLESRTPQNTDFASLELIGAIPDPKSGWVSLLVFCRLNITSNEIEMLRSTAPGHEYNNLIFVKNNPRSLSELLSRPNVYPSQYGGYHAFFKVFHPELVK